MAKGEYKLTFGFFIRLGGGTICALSIPFLVVTPTNIIAQSLFTFGGAILIIGGLIE